MLLFQFFICSTLANRKARDLADQIKATVDTKTGWEEGFLNFAGFAATSVELCENLQKCANSFKIYFERVVADDPSKAYLTMVFCGKGSLKIT